MQGSGELDNILVVTRKLVLDHSDVDALEGHAEASGCLGLFDEVSDRAERVLVERQE